MSEPRLTTEFRIRAAIRRADLDSIAVAVLHKGDPTAGAVLIRLDRRAAGCTVLIETRDQAGRPAWLKGTGDAPVAGADADAYIDRSRKRDPDLWVIEIDDEKGRLPFDEKVLGS